MFRPHLISSITFTPDDDNNEKILGIVSISSNRSVAVTSMGHILAYDNEKLLQTYKNILVNKIDNISFNVNDMKYSFALSTIFIQLDKSIELLSSSNFNHYDTILDKGGFQTKLFLFEQQQVSHNNKNDKYDDIDDIVHKGKKLLCYATKQNGNFVLLKCFIWNEKNNFERFLEKNIVINHGDEVVRDFNFYNNKIYVATTHNAYVWDILGPYQTPIKINNFYKKKWFNIIDTILREEQLIQKNGYKNTNQISLADDIDTNNDILSTYTRSVINEQSSVTSIKSKSSWFQSWFPSMNSTNIIYPNMRFIEKYKKRQYFYKFYKSSLDEKLYLITYNGKVYQLSNNVKENRHNNAKVPSLLEINEYSPVLIQALPLWNSYPLVDLNFFYCYDSKVVTIYHPIYGYTYGQLFLDSDDDSIELVHNIDEHIIIKTKNNSIKVYSISVDDCNDCDIYDDSLVSYQERMVFWDTVLFDESCRRHEKEHDNANFFRNQLLKSRDISVVWGLKCLDHVINFKNNLLLQKYCVSQIFDVFVNFLAPPDLIIPYINMLSGNLNRAYVIPYFIEIRRYLQNLQDKNWDKCLWKNLKIDTDFFTIEQSQLKDDLFFNHRQNISTKGNKESSLEQLLILVDTTLFELYLRTSPSLLGPFLRLHNMCDADVVVKELTEKHKFQELINFYFTRKDHERALYFITHLNDYVPNVPLDVIVELTFSYIRQLTNENINVIFKYLNWIFEQDWQDKSTKDLVETIFFQDTTQFDNLKVFEYIVSMDTELGYLYLEYCIDTLACKNPEIYSKLITYYLKNLTPLNLKKVHALVETKPYYESFELLSLLDDKLNTASKKLTDNEKKILTHCKTFALKKMGDHKAALKILITDLNNYPMAKQYCESVIKSGDGSDDTSVLTDFVDVLKKEPNHNKFLLFLQDFAVYCTPSFLVNLIPLDISINAISKYLLENVILKQKMLLNDERLKKSMYKVSLIDKDYKLLEKKAEYFIIPEHSKCVVCKKPVSISRVPDGIFQGFTLNGKNVVVHFNCGNLLAKKLKNNKQVKKLSTLGNK
ncbi:uncharacterized protein SCODWIG_01341 [Saccharomycodes ludwigii]|uniref:Vacuolar sorting protein 39/Transforming growth factor beta receptor-associated domain-containing protein n=1 Tax=Saccharomycodes ludwigii TaxID=36035 RepID=A0A376B642_9ASCO|nr:hypothetical protein SCDLUD_004281 [Saccharomycodes ludwigii]KAH3899965.1 hypothetical protein SCDLUD_004281 [Saccharomycodes ludwigii]SSD59580.1 uncharacterized protein SCODWIG_01341 [Saccharomycodes ludwigii]